MVLTYIIAKRPKQRLDEDGKYSLLLLGKYQEDDNLDTPENPKTAVTGSI